PRKQDASASACRTSGPAYRRTWRSSIPSRRAGRAAPASGSTSPNVWSSATAVLCGWREARRARCSRYRCRRKEADPMSRILVADDEPKLGKLVAEMLQLEGHEIVRVQGGRGALVELSARPFEMVVTDLRMPEVDGLAVLRDARARGADVILMTAYGTAESAVD